MNSTVNSFVRSTEAKSKRFFEILNQNHLNVTLRKEHGHDIDAACGQLRIKKLQGKI